MPHIEHCCLRHGCKYGKSDCPVASGADQQEIPCESCMEEEHILVMGFNHLGREVIPSDILDPILWTSKGRYLIPLEVLGALTEKYDVQVSHRLGNKAAVGLWLTLEAAGGPHRRQ